MRETANGDAKKGLPQDAMHEKTRKSSKGEAPTNEQDGRIAIKYLATIVEDKKKVNLSATTRASR